MSTTFLFFKKYWWIILLILLALIFSFLFFNNKKDDNIKIIKPKIQTIQKKIEISGNVVPSKESSLSFERSGVVNRVNVKVGDKVKAGQVLASISSDDIYAQILESKAQLESQEAILEQLKSGPTEAEKRLKEQIVSNAKEDLNNAELQVKDTIKNINNTLKDIFDFRLSGFFVKENSFYKINFVNCDQSLQFKLEIERSNFDNFDITDLENASNVLKQVNNFINNLNDLVNANCVNQDPRLSEKRSIISSLKTIITSLSSEIFSKRSILQTSKNNLARAERELEIILSGTDKNRIASQEAVVKQAKARILQLQSQLNKTQIIAPFNGVITEVNINKGEISSISRVAIKIISDSLFDIKAKASESDISFLQKNMQAKVFLDAYGDKVVFPAVISNIDPAAVNESGSPRYNVTLTFLDKDERIKVGMTANVSVIVEEKENTLTIPISFLKIKDKKEFVLIKEGEKEIEKEVKTGIRDGGVVEILEGIDKDTLLVEVAKEGKVVR